MDKKPSLKIPILWMVVALLWVVCLVRDKITGSTMMSWHLIALCFSLSAGIAALIRYFKIRNS